MCYTMLCINCKDNWSVIRQTFSHLKTNQDGFFIRIIGKKDNMIRTLHIKEFFKFISNNRKNIRNAKIIHLHYRTKSSGDINEDNIHGWSQNGWSFSHNGCANLLHEKYSDSKLLWDNIIKNKITPQKVKESIEKWGLWGIYLLVSPIEQIVVSQSKPLYIYSDGRGLIFSSDDLELNKKIKIGGIEFIKQIMWQTTIENKLIHINSNLKIEAMPIHINTYKYRYGYYDIWTGGNWRGSKIW